MHRLTFDREQLNGTLKVLSRFAGRKGRVNFRVRESGRVDVHASNGTLGLQHEMADVIVVTDEDDASPGFSLAAGPLIRWLAQGRGALVTIESGGTVISGGNEANFSGAGGSSEFPKFPARATISVSAKGMDRLLGAVANLAPREVEEANQGLEMDVGARELKFLASAGSAIAEGVTQFRGNPGKELRGRHSLRPEWVPVIRAMLASSDDAVDVGLSDGHLHLRTGAVRMTIVHEFRDMGSPAEVAEAAGPVVHVSRSELLTAVRMSAALSDGDFGRGTVIVTPDAVTVSGVSQGGESSGRCRRADATGGQWRADVALDVWARLLAVGDEARVVLVTDPEPNSPVEFDLGESFRAVCMPLLSMQAQKKARAAAKAKAKPAAKAKAKPAAKAKAPAEGGSDA